MGPSLVLPGALDRDAFEAYVERVLVPTLRPGQTVVLDNLSVHKSARARQLVEAAGCALRFLPTYSPDLNPIEQAFAKLKGRLRRAEARTFAAVADAIGAAFPAITAADARSFYRDAGYNLWQLTMALGRINGGMKFEPSLVISVASAAYLRQESANLRRVGRMVVGTY